MAQQLDTDRTRYNRYAMMDAERDEFDIAFERALMNGANVVFAFAMAHACQDYLVNRGRFSQLLDWFTRLEAPLRLSLKNVPNHPTWAAFQNSLGMIYEAHPLSVKDPSYLKRAIEAFEESQHYYKQNVAPFDYAMTQNNIGNVYGRLALFEYSQENFHRAISSYINALQIFSPEQFRFEYAMTKNNIGLIYTGLADLEDTIENLNRAIVSHSEALRFYTSDDAPSEYATTLFHIANVYVRFAHIENETFNLKLSIDFYRRSLQFRTADADPQGYAETQMNLGSTLARSGDLRSAIQCWQEAKKYFIKVNNKNSIDSLEKMILSAEAKIKTDEPDDSTETPS